MKLVSDFRSLGKVELPKSAGRQKYMHTVNLAAPSMPHGFEDYLTPVLTLCQRAGLKSGVVHVTIDEKTIKCGMSQRRPGPHVDGCFVPKSMSWHHNPSPDGGWLHNCNNIPSTVDVSRMPVIVASSVSGCRAWRGEFEGIPKDDGDCSHIELGDDDHILPANEGFLLSPDCVHESMIFEQDTTRTFLRIALPNDFEHGMVERDS